MIKSGQVKAHRGMIVEIPTQANLKMVKNKGKELLLTKMVLFSKEYSKMTKSGQVKAHSTIKAEIPTLVNSKMERDMAEENLLELMVQFK